jgi:hypothetical protein
MIPFMRWLGSPAIRASAEPFAHKGVTLLSSLTADAALRRYPARTFG